MYKLMYSPIENEFENADDWAVWDKYETPAEAVLAMASCMNDDLKMGQPVKFAYYVEKEED